MHSVTFIDQTKEETNESKTEGRMKILEEDKKNKGVYEDAFF